MAAALVHGEKGMMHIFTFANISLTLSNLLNWLFDTTYTENIRKAYTLSELAHTFIQFKLFNDIDKNININVKLVVSTTKVTLQFKYNINMLQ